MIKWLASVQSLEETQALSTCLPDIVDMKQPSQGALGALPVETVQSIVAWLDGKTLTSATIGDLPMQAEIIMPALKKMASTGVDFVKIGLFNESTLQTCIEELQQPVCALPVPVIAVLFADQTEDLSFVELLKNSGFAGVMVDTAIKDGRGLLNHWPISKIQQFITTVKKLDMLCGLAGALKIEDIQQLKGLNADYLGFRSALCINRERTADMRPELAQHIQNELRPDVAQAV